MMNGVIVQAMAIVAIALAGAYVGYHAWQDSINAPEDAAAHLIDFGFAYHGDDRQTADAKSYPQRPPLF